MKIKLALQHTLKSGSTIRNHFETKAIQLWSWSKHFHSELIIDDKWISSGPTHGGVFMHKLHRLNHDRWDYFDIEIDEDKIEETLEWIKSQIGSGYDWAGVFLLGINSNTHNVNKWFCSEVCAEMLKRLGVSLKLDSNQYTPAGLLVELKEIAHEDSIHI